MFVDFFKGVIWRDFLFSFSLVCYGAVCASIRSAELSPLHTESEFFVWNFRTLKDKYDLTLCQSRCTLPPKFASVMKKFGSGSIFLHFSHSWQEFWEVFWQFRVTVEANAKIQNGDCQVDPLRLAAQSTVYRSLHTEFTEIGGLLFNMWLYHTEPLMSWSKLWIARDNPAAP